MGYSIEAINSEDNSVKKREALQEQLLKANILQDGKTQRDGTKVEEPRAVTSAEHKTDTINISTQGQFALEQMKAEKSDSSSANTIRNADRKKSDTASSVPGEKKTDSTDKSDSKSESASTKSIYSMSKSELNVLVSEGLISSQEVKKELKRRSEITFPPDTQQ